MKCLILFCFLFSLAATREGSPDVSHRSENDPTGRITNGMLAEPKQFPYQVFLYAQDIQTWCGGSIISSRWILTAAHCTDFLVKGIDVYMGTENLDDQSGEHSNIIFVERKYIFEHEAWNRETFVNDISLIKLPFEIEFNDYIQPVNLPKRNESGNTYENKTVLTSGWGLFNSNETEHEIILRWMETSILDNEECIPYFEQDLLINPEMICVRAENGISPCKGDSGGPLVLADGSFTLIGITSYGNYFCEYGTPVVFTRTTSYLDWIDAKTGLII